jgi:hypothetical protein
MGGVVPRAAGLGSTTLLASTSTVTPMTRVQLGGWLALLAGCPGPDQLSWNTTTGVTEVGTTFEDVTTTTTHEGGTTTRGETEGDDGSLFVSDPTDGGVTFECSVWSRDCPDGQKCTYWGNDGGSAWNATKCVPVAPDPVGSGEPCVVQEHATSGLDDCDFGSMCWYVDPARLTGECVPFCQGSESNLQCDEGRWCRISASAVLLLCLEKCHPFDAPCGPGKLCTWHGSWFTCFPDASGDDGAYGDHCEYLNACAAGLFCAAAHAVPGCQGAQGCCSEYCDLSDPTFECAGADGGQVCLSWYEDGQAPEGFETLGLCAIPS